ncbi:MAG: hypothetical protein GXO48_03700, partial [Chlorobi bacterium]|nr:hypothetical protein [Chlorobiota bacterium]
MLKEMLVRAGVIAFLVVGWAIQSIAQKTGIGTNTPAARFHIAVPGTWTDSVFMITRGTNTLINITRDAKVGIGTATPAANLHVVGNARITNLAGTFTSLVISNTNGDLSILTFPNDATKVLLGD